jgi:hypothetical protein
MPPEMASRCSLSHARHTQGVSMEAGGVVTHRLPDFRGVLSGTLLFFPAEPEGRLGSHRAGR